MNNLSLLQQIRGSMRNPEPLSEENSCKVAEPGLTFAEAKKTARPRGLIGSNRMGFGRTTATNRAPATLSSSTGMMKTDRTGYLTMWVLFKRLRMAASTLSRAILATSAARTAIQLGTMRFTDTVYQLINQPKKKPAACENRRLVYIQRTF